MPRDRRLNLEQSALIATARVLGLQTALPVYLENDELSRVASVILADTGNHSLIPASLRSDLRGDIKGYYDLALDWFDSKAPVGVDFVDLFLSVSSKVSDFPTYFKCLCELHKRRRKYSQILVAQPLPTMLQVSPRALLEFGIIATPALASWLTWRKWFFDIDNRAGQETGYLFEPILASALGGKSFASGKSPVKRSSDPAKGRQVDCIVGKTAYEFKLRVTIAASGQGRFAEELEFAADCRKSGFTPVLMVLDPTPSSRLDDLAAEFKRYGGRAYIGDDAWEHLESESGPTMATFIEKYVRRPIEAIDEHADGLLDLAISAQEAGKFSVTLSRGRTAYKWDIIRHEDQSLANNNGSNDNE